MAMASVSSVAPLAPTQSTFTCRTQCSWRSRQQWSAYQADPPYRAWEWPDQNARRRSRRSRFFRAAKMRPTSICVALPAPLSIAP